ncbi:UvrB/UvrC motif-containing protein [Clostridium massiliamazoniense]|uniref:UvrB/UvrC motif-containing protein n=1 Tax=Clostridium massiliamazoniense TaxID=1347366 RepID=UPI0006D78C8F|nr:UvrB/UvrC motif-containing protein [Clostridium massiliamazoniense]
MICEICKKNKAVVHFINIVNGKKKHKMLCEECALKINNISVEEEVKEELNFNKILNGLLDYMDNYKEDEKSELFCKKCGRTYKDFKESGICGCSECYKVFSQKYDFLEGKEHIGKVPRGKREEIKNKRSIDNLRIELKELIKNEEFEKAATVRDKLKDLEKEFKREEE